MSEKAKYVLCYNNPWAQGGAECPVLDTIVARTPTEVLSDMELFSQLGRGWYYIEYEDARARFPHAELWRRHRDLECGGWVTIHSSAQMAWTCADA